MFNAFIIRDEFAKVNWNISKAPPKWRGLVALLFLKRQAVRALIHAGMALMGANLDLVQKEVVLGCAVVCTGDDGALDALVRMTFHNEILL